MTERPFEGRIALVTGAGSGIGRATAMELARSGARVGVLSRDAAAVTATVAAIEREGGTALPLAADVTREEDLARAVGGVRRMWGRLDLVVANAGANGVWAPLDELSREEWEQTLRTNLTGAFLTVRACLPLLRRQGGAIVVTSSVNGTRNFSNTGATAYASSKAAQVAFVKMAALELARDRIRINVVSPGWIATAIQGKTVRRDIERVKLPVRFPAGRFPLRGEPAEPEQAARLIAFLLSDAADHITGTELWIDGGESLLVG